MCLVAVALSSTLSLAQDAGSEPSNVVEESVAVPPPAIAGHEGLNPSVPRDLIENSSEVPARTIEVVTVDPRDIPVPNVMIELVPHAAMSSNSTKPQEPIQRVPSNGDGRVVFTNIPQTAESTYRLTVVVGEVRTSSAPFVLDQKVGTKAKLHVFPAVSDLRQALVVARSFWFLEPREEGIYLELFTEFLNLGSNTWSPSGLVIDLPPGVTSFSAMGNDPDVVVRQSGDELTLSGAIGPGQHDVTFSFQIPSKNERDQDLVLPLFPQTAEVRVATVVRPGLSLSVEGYPEPQATRANGQVPIILTSRAYNREGLPPPEDIRLTLAGLPVQGPGRIVAVSMALLIALGGLVGFFAQRRRGRQDATNEDVREAKERLLDELAQVTRAHREGQMSEETFLETQQVLVAAAVRLERQVVSIGN
jgi:hypothetical protein